MEKDEERYKSICPYCDRQAVSPWKRMWISPQNSMNCKSCGAEVYPEEKASYLMDIPLFLFLVIGYVISLIFKKIIYFFPIFYLGVFISLYLQHRYVPLKAKNNI